jgi:hypothetical protein
MDIYIPFYCFLFHSILLASGDATGDATGGSYLAGTHCGLYSCPIGQLIISLSSIGGLNQWRRV